MLDFVQHYESEREVTVDRQRVSDGGGHLVAGDVGDLRKLFLEELASVGLGVRQVRAGLQQRFRQVAGHVHVRQLLRQRAACSLKFGFDLV